MALVYLDSFATYDSANIGSRWTVAGSPTIDPTAGRLGRPGLVGAANASVARTIPASGTIIFACAMKFAIGAGTEFDLISFRDSATTQVKVAYKNAKLQIVGPSGVLVVGSTILLSGETRYVEFKATIGSSVAASSCVLRIDGVVECEAPAASDTQATANSFADGVVVGIGISFNDVTVTINDLCILDGTGAINNDFLGDQKVEAIFPAADGTASDWTANGATNDWDCVKQVVPDGDTTYVASDTVDDYDMFGFADLPAGASAIRGVQVTTVARKDDVGDRSIAPVLEVGGTRYDGTGVALGNTYRGFSQAWDQNPDTTADWTEAEVNTLEAGVKLVS